MDQIQELGEAINAGGNISPSWVLSGITVIAGFLIWNQIKDIKYSIRELSESLKGVNSLLQLHDKQIAVMQAKLGKDKED